MKGTIILSTSDIKFALIFYKTESIDALIERLLECKKALLKAE